eukprot:1607919-Amphidinium_carterae.1
MHLSPETLAGHFRGMWVHIAEARARTLCNLVHALDHGSTWATSWRIHSLSRPGIQSAIAPHYITMRRDVFASIVRRQPLGHVNTMSSTLLR